MPPANRPSRTESSRSSNCSPCAKPLGLPWVASSMPCSIRMESSAAIGPGPATIWAWLSGVTEKPPPAALLAALRLTADVSTRLGPLISTGMSHCDTPASPSMVKEGLSPANYAQKPVKPRVLGAVIGMSRQDGQGAIDLFGEQRARQKMRPGLGTEGQA